jgi:putative CocE/NonD family hydrolase
MGIFRFQSKVPRRAALLAVSVLALAAPASAAKHKRWTNYERPATYTVKHVANVAITMRDGVVLRANLDLPDAPGPFPTLVVQTPYNKDGLINVALGGSFRYFAERGYAVVTVDVRGTGASGGEWDSFGEAEQADGPEVVEWAAAQPWSTGDIGLMGPSYMGLNQLLTAAQRPPHLKAIFPVVPMADSYRDIVFKGGQINLSFIPLWLGLVTAGNLIPTPAADDPAQTLAALLTHVAGAVDFTIPTVLSGASGSELAFDGDFWKRRSPLEAVDRINVPAFVVGGLHDLFQRGEPLIYERLKRHVPARLLMGPWDHLGGSSGAGLPRDAVPALNQIELRWFDHWLMGIDTRIAKIPRATQYVYGKERYKTQADWPDPRLRPRRWYLSGDQHFDQNPLPSTRPGRSSASSTSQARSSPTSG